ncbi:MAG: hypothetical protein KatS3mg105_1735 [Gemmatales bacterium]|nr:MAG: hypothetical protein KatS3mg105_1735 [Gemmatales bacterium]
MRTKPSWLWMMISGAVVAWLPASASFAATPRIRDHAKLFSAEVVAQITREIEQIQFDYHKDIVIDTFRHVPFYKKIPLLKNSWQQVDKENPDEVEHFFLQWARRRVPGLSGIYILIFVGEGGPVVQVATRSDPRMRRALSEEDRTKLRHLLLERIEDKQYDDALIEGVHFIRDRLEAHIGKQSPYDFNWVGAVIVILVLFGLWLIVEFGRAVVAGTRAGFAGVNTYGYGVGGGLLSVLSAVRVIKNKKGAPVGLKQEAPVTFSQVSGGDEEQGGSAEESGAGADSGNVKDEMEPPPL